MTKKKSIKNLQISGPILQSSSNEIVKDQNILQHTFDCGDYSTINQETHESENLASASNQKPSHHESNSNLMQHTPSQRSQISEKTNSLAGSIKNSHEISGSLHNTSIINKSFSSLSRSISVINKFKKKVLKSKNSSSSEHLKSSISQPAMIQQQNSHTLATVIDHQTPSKHILYPSQATNLNPQHIPQHPPHYSQNTTLPYAYEKENYPETSNLHKTYFHYQARSHPPHETSTIYPEEPHNPDHTLKNATFNHDNMTNFRPQYSVPAYHYNPTDLEVQNNNLLLQQIDDEQRRFLREQPHHTLKNILSNSGSAGGNNLNSNSTKNNPHAGQKKSFLDKNQYKIILDRAEDGYKSLDLLGCMIEDRNKLEIEYSRNLKKWSENYNKLIINSGEYNLCKKIWLDSLDEANGIADVLESGWFFGGDFS